MPGILGLPPTTPLLSAQVIYTTLIHGCILAKDVDLAWETFDHMRQRDAIEPDAVTFSVMIYACAKVAFFLSSPP